MNAPTISAFARDKGTRLTRGVQEALHPIVNDKGLVAVRVVFLYEADGQMLAGALDLQLDPGAGAFLEDLMRQRLGGALKPAYRQKFVTPVMRKS